MFGETNGCLLVEVRPGDRVAFEDILAGLPICPAGRVTADPSLSIISDDETLVCLFVEALVQAWEP